MADPDIRRMGKKHKKHKKDHSQLHNVRLPGFLPERVPMPEEPVNEMKVVLRLPRPMENHNGRLRFAPPISHHRGYHDTNRSSLGVMTAHPAVPRELIVSIPFTALYQEEEEEEPVVQTEATDATERHHHTHKHKKHKKHKKHHHHHHDSAHPPQPEEVRGHFGGPGMGMYSSPVVGMVQLDEPSPPAPPIRQKTSETTMTVAPLRIQVPKPSTDSTRTLSKHKHSHSHTHHEDNLLVERHTRPPKDDTLSITPPGAIPSGKHMHTHKHHHHKHKEKRHHHRTGFQDDEHVMGYRDNKDVLGGDDDDDLNEWGQVTRITPPTKFPGYGGKPTSFMIAEERKTSAASDEYSPIGGTGDRQPSSHSGSHEGHKHHKKKKKKHHKHSKHSLSHSETEVSPTVARLSDMESEDSRQGYFTTTPLSTGSRSTTQAHVHVPSPVDTPQEVRLVSQEPTPMRSPIKESRRFSQEAGMMGHSSSRETQRSSQEAGIMGHSSSRETQRSSQDGSGSSSNRLPLRRLSQDTRTAKLKVQSPDVQPPPHKRAKMDDQKETPPSAKFDISQTKGLDIEPRDTPLPVNTQFQPSLRHQTSQGSSDSIATTPVTVAKPLTEARRPSTGDKTYTASAVAPSPPVPNPAEMKTPQVRLSKDTLQLFLKNLHHLIQRRDPDGIFADPVTDDIAPGYSALISIPMDLTTIATKIDMGQYESVVDFKSDFILMCNNAMTYNAPETVYYGSAKRLLTTGLQIIAKETSLRPDIRHGTTALIPSRSVSPTPVPMDARIPTPPVNIKVDYSSPFLCRVDLSILRGTSGGVMGSIGSTGLVMGGVGGGAHVPLSEQQDYISVDVNGLSDITNQSHLTKVVIGCDDEEKEETEEDRVDQEEDVFGSLAPPESPDEILMQAEEAAETMKENLDTNKPQVKFTFLNQDDSGKTMLNILNPDTGSVDVSSPLDLTTLSDHVRMGNNAATVLKTELPLMRATPVSYLMYGPFGSFAPAYDSSFATLTKMDSDLLLQSYGSELGVSYAHSLQQFVKGAGSFVTEMADAVLNGLTNSRHSKFMAKFREFEEKERKLREVPATTSPESASLSRNNSRDEAEKLPTSAKEGEESTSIKVKDETSNLGEDVVEKDSITEQQMDTSESTQDSKEDLITNDDSRGSLPSEEPPPSTSLETEDSNSNLDKLSEVSSSGSSSLRKPREVSSLSREASVGVDQVSGRSSATPGATEEGEEAMEQGKDGEGDEMDEEAALLLGELEDIGSLGSGESVPVVSRATSESNSRVASPGSIDPLQKLTSLSEAPLDTDIDSQLEHTSHLLDKLHDQQRERLSLAPIDLDDGHLILPGPSDEEVKIASDLRAGLVQLTAQARPGDVVSVPALHDAMGITVEAVAPGEEAENQMELGNSTQTTSSLTIETEHRESP